MKTLFVTLSLIGLMSFTLQGPGKKEISSLLSNQQTRQEIFQAIQGNQNLMTEFMQEMHGHQQAIMWQGNTKFMNQRYMLNLMQSNPGFMQRMMSSMVGASAKDSTWSRQMIRQMEQYPQMMQMMNSYSYHHGMMGNNHQGMMMEGSDQTMMHSYSNDQ